MPAGYTGIYITDTDVNVAPVAASITSAGYSAADIGVRIDEAEEYVEGALVALGYTRTQFTTPNTTPKLVKRLCILYTWYLIMRDVYTQNSPSYGRHGNEEYGRWKSEVDEYLAKLASAEVAIRDANGIAILPTVNPRYKVVTNTEDVPRADGLMPDEDKEIDPKYYDDDVVGNP